MKDMVLSTITNGELTEKQSDKVQSVCKMFGESFKDLATVFVRYAEVNDTIDVAFCEYVHNALEKLKKSDVKNKNKVFAELTGVEYTKVTKCNKVYTDVMQAVKQSTIKDMGYDSTWDLFSEYSFSQLYTLTAIQCGATIEKLIRRNINNYTIAEIRFIIENIKAKNPVEDIVDDEIVKRIHYIGQKLDIKKFDEYEWNSEKSCFTAKNKPNENKPNENKPNENKPNENKSSENKPNENKPNENKPNENKPNENKSSENKPNENKPNENKPNENKPNENKPDTLDINAILEYIRACTDINELQSIKAVSVERIKAIKK